MSLSLSFKRNLHLSISGLRHIRLIFLIFWFIAYHWVCWFKIQRNSIQFSEYMQQNIHKPWSYYKTFKMWSLYWEFFFGLLFDFLQLNSNWNKIWRRKLEKCAYWFLKLMPEPGEYRLTTCKKSNRILLCNFKKPIALQKDLIYLTAFNL